MKFSIKNYDDDLLFNFILIVVIDDFIIFGLWLVSRKLFRIEENIFE
jgi:hypothetical protein